MDDLITDLKDAAATLKLVANSLHTPLDTTTFDAALAAVVAALKPAPVAPKPAPAAPADSTK